MKKGFSWLLLILLSSDYYRPTDKSTMNNIDVNNPNIQFGPVNTYYMEASFKTRIGLITAMDQGCSFDPYNNKWIYEWPYYLISQFLIDWPPSWF
ncbi:MAG TPA: hypothetical protein PK771_09000 [Spirochaetota bacterium]|nr:hypothetical protein [Spirochaetota bacterium]